VIPKPRHSTEITPLSDCQPQGRQVDFSSLIFTANRTSLEQKEIFSIFSRSGEARIVFIHRYFHALVNLFTNLPPEPISREGVKAINGNPVQKD